MLLAGLMLLVFAARELSWLLAPLLTALMIVTLVHPVHTALVRRRVPGPLALGGLLIAVYGSVGAVTALIVYALSRFAGLVTSYGGEIQAAVESLRDGLADIGVATPQAGELLEGIDVPSAALWLSGRIPSVLALATTAVLLGTVLLFIGIESTQLDVRVRALHEQHPHMYSALAHSAQRTRHFFVVTTGFAVIIGIADTLLLLALDIPLAPLWGMLAAVCNYIPYLGFWVGMVPPALLGLAAHDWRTMVAIIVAYLLLNFLVTSLLPAKFIGDAVGISMTLEVVAIVFWAWVLGPVGAILAIPLTILVKAVLVDGRPGAGAIAGFLDSAKSIRGRSGRSSSQHGAHPAPPPPRRADRRVGALQGDEGTPGRRDRRGRKPGRGGRCSPVRFRAARRADPAEVSPSRSTPACGRVTW